MARTRTVFASSLVAVIALVTLVLGVVVGRASGSGGGNSGGGGSGGTASGSKVDVIIKASDSSFWQVMLAGAKHAGSDFGLQVGTFGHMGDGNLHPTFLTDERDADEMARVHHALDLIAKKTLELGGTITGEHGVGLAKKTWLRQQMGDSSFDVMKQIKKALDPAGLLNPGKIFD